MLRRQDTLLLVGAVMVAISGALYFNPFNNEPMWVEWILSSILVYVGLPLAILGRNSLFWDKSQSRRLK